MFISTICVIFLDVLCEMHSYLHAPLVLVAEGLRFVNVQVLLVITVLYWFLSSFGMILFMLEIG